VRSCWFYPVLGNVKNASARAIWRDAATQKLRERMTHCPHFGETKCASSCLAHRTLAEDVRRVVLMVRSGLDAH